MGQLNAVIAHMENSPNARFHYIFNNAPDNEHSLSKREAVGADGSVVIDGGYRVNIKLTQRSIVKGSYDGAVSDLLQNFATHYCDRG